MRNLRAECQGLWIVEHFRLDANKRAKVLCCGNVFSSKVWREVLESLTQELHGEIQNCWPYIDFSVTDYSPSDNVSLRNVVSGMQNIVSRGGDPVSEPWFLDASPTPSRAKNKTYFKYVDCQSCIVAQASCGGFWIACLQRMVTDKGMFKLMACWMRCEKWKVDCRLVGKAVGNSISVEVLSPNLKIRRLRFACDDSSCHYSWIDPLGWMHRWQLPTNVEGAMLEPSQVGVLLEKTCRHLSNHGMDS